MMHVETRDDTCHVQLQGELTIYQAQQFSEQLIPLLECREPIVLDLSDVSDIDTSCAQVLMVARRARLSHGKGFALVNHSQPVIDAFETLGLVSWFGDPVVLKVESPARRADDQAAPAEGAAS